MIGAPIPLQPKRTPPIGNCIACGQHIRLTGGATTCGTCRAWHRWYRAWRLSSRYMRDAQR